jgi:hypothetical protein
MGSRLLFARNLLGIAPWASLLTLAACSSLLGIDTVHEGPPPGVGGQGGDGTAGAAAGGAATHAGNGGGAGKASAGGSAGKGSAGDNSAGDLSGAGVAGDSSVAGSGAGGAGGAHAGASGAGAGAGGAGAGAGGAHAGAGGAGAGGAGMSGAGGAGSGGTTVTGHVIDYWGHPVPNVPVQIGDTLASTNAQGVFVAGGVPALYDATLVIDYSDSGSRHIYGWAYQGLTRRDPTLQVYSGLVQRSANIVITPSNAVLNSTRALTVALGGPDGSDEFTGVEANGVQTTTDWRGPASTQERAHGLLWQFDAASQLPTSYVGYDTASAALADTSATTNINLNLTATASIPSGNITGTITPAGGADRANKLYLHFSSGANIALASDSPGPNTFSYLVPTIANASVILAAVEGDAAFGQYAVAHKDNLAAGTSAITATIPTPSKPLTPATGALNVDGSTPFTFQAGAGSAGGFVVSMLAEDFYDGLFIVTTNKSNFKVPVIVSGAYALVSTHVYDWRVETHGNLATVDAMAGPSGFMDEFSGNNESPRGPHTADGSFTISQSNRFTAK